MSYLLRLNEHCNTISHKRFVLNQQQAIYMCILGIVVELANLVPSVSHLTAPWSEAHEGEHQ